MVRFEPSLCQCSVGMLCCASGVATGIFAIALLLVG